MFVMTLLKICFACLLCVPLAVIIAFLYNKVIDEIDKDKS